MRGIVKNIVRGSYFRIRKRELHAFLIVALFLMGIFTQTSLPKKVKTESEKADPYSSFNPSSYAPIRSIPDSITNSGSRANETMSIGGPTDSTIKDVSFNDISIYSNHNYFLNSGDDWVQSGDISLIPDMNSTSINFSITGANDTAVFMPLPNHNITTDPFYGLDFSQHWRRYVNDTGASISHNKYNSYDNNTSTGCVLTEYSTVSNWVNNFYCFAELQLPFYYNNSFEYNAVIYHFGIQSIFQILLI